MSHGGHEVVQCSCGNVIAQCRCIEGGKNIRVVKNGCQSCKERLTESGKKTK